MNYSQYTNIELLQCLLGNRAAKRLYRGRLAPLFVPEGVLSRKHQQLGCARELVERWLKEELVSTVTFSSPKIATDYLCVLFAGQHVESFVTLFLNAQNRLIAVEEMFRGTLTQTAVYPREIVKRALELNAVGTIFAHNHPSGVSEPSSADIRLTERLKQALALVDISVLDHLVIAGGTAASFAERGLL